ncbi:SDR family oxidoreductase [Pseudonocardia saturnea]
MDLTGRVAVSTLGRIDVMVTNAGVLRERVLWKMTDEDFDAVVAVHLRGTFTCARAAAVRMRAQGTGGRLILAASPAGQRGNFGQTNYAAAKAGIAAMARTWALELATAGITANAIVPVAATEERGEPLPSWLRHGEGFGTVQDVAGLVVFLASDASSDVTGQAIGIGGDKLALWAHPHEREAAYTAGGWTADAIADSWSTGVGRTPETYGIPAPGVPVGQR